MATNWELTGVVDGYGMRQTSRSCPDPVDPYALLYDEEMQRPRRSVWDRILGLTTIVVVNTVGWIAIIALARRLK